MLSIDTRIKTIIKYVDIHYIFQLEIELNCCCLFGLESFGVVHKYECSNNRSISNLIFFKQKMCVVFFVVVTI